MAVTNSVMLVILLLVFGCETASILLLPNPFPSHWSWMAEIGKELYERNHQVYAVVRDSDEMRVHFECKDIHTLSYTLSPHKAESKISDDLENIVMEMLKNRPPSDFDVFKQNIDMLAIMEKESNYLLQDEMLKDTLKSMHFDLAIVDGAITNLYLYVIPYALEIPYISTTPFYLIRTMGLPALPSYHPVPGLLPFSDRMTFPQRLLNTFLFILEHWYEHIFSNNPAETISKYSSKHQDISFYMLARNSRMWLIQQLQPLDWPKVALPHVVNIGPLSMQPSEKLPPDLLSWIEHDSGSGLIVFSFGTLNSRLPFWLMSKFLQAFSQLDNKVIGRYTGKGCNNTAENVKMFPWIPQNDLLGHPSTSLFVSHCGNGGLYEALYHGVPMLGLPLFGDHTYNCKRIEDRGYGIVLNFTMTTEDLLTAIQEVLHNPEYRKRAKKASAILKRDPHIPMDKAIYWIEYVLDFGADHLRSPSLDFPWYKYFCVDTLLTLIIIMLLILSFSFLIARHIYRSIFIPLYLFFFNKVKQD